MQIGEYLSKHADDNFKINTNLELISRLKRNADLPLKVLISQMEAQINNAIDAFVDDGNWIAKQIDKIPNGQSKIILKDRYLLFRTWNEISQNMHISLDELPFHYGQAITLLEQNCGKAV